jgi:hypothetical protein
MLFIPPQLEEKTLANENIVWGLNLAKNRGN